jgi:hypothetical protein
MAGHGYGIGRRRHGRRALAGIVAVVAAIQGLAAAQATSAFAVGGATGTTGPTGSSECPKTESNSYPIIFSISPAQGPASGGNKVVIRGQRFVVIACPPLALAYAPRRVMFGSKEAKFELNEREEAITAVVPPGTGTVEVSVETLGRSRNGPQYTYIAPTETLSFPSWTLSGSLTDAKLEQTITLPAGSTFTGSGELNTETGAGSLTGKISVPAFAQTLKLFGLIPVTLGLRIGQATPSAGTLTRSEVTPGDEVLALQLGVNLHIDSVSLLGLTIPTECATVEPVALGVSQTLSLEELRTGGFGSSGSTALPPFTCEGGLLGWVFGEVLTGILSGPNNSYTLSAKP